MTTAGEFVASSGAGGSWEGPADTAGAAAASEESPPLPPLGGGAPLTRRAAAFGRGARTGSRLRSIGHGPGGAEVAPPTFGEVEEAEQEASSSAATAGAVTGVSRRRGGTAGAGSTTAQRRQGLWWLETWPGAGLITWLGQQLDAR